MVSLTLLYAVGTITILALLALGLYDCYANEN